jgi:hypothetical protein
VSLVAKVFVVLNLVVSVTFLIFAMNVWTAQTKWQRMYELEKAQNVPLLVSHQKREKELSMEVLRNAKQFEDKKRENIELRLKWNEQRDKAQDLSVKLATSENKAAMAEAENQEIQRENRRMGEDLQKIKGVVLKQQQALVIERENAVRAKNEKSDVENELNMSKQTLSAVTKDKRQIEDDLAQQTARIEGLLRHGVPIAQILGEEAGATQPAIADGRVLGVKPEIKICMLSIGSQQGVKPGYQFTVKRGDQYITKVQVDKVYPDMCVARYIDGYMNKQGLDIELNDEVLSH